MRASLVAAVLLAGTAACASRAAVPPRDLDARVRGVTEGLAGETLAARMERHRVPGVSIAVVDEYRLSWAHGYGLRSAASSDPVTPETLFRGSSISKAVTAAVALQLVEEGRLDLDGDVNDRLVSWRVPDNAFTARKAVTLRQLLGHAACVNRPDGGFGHEEGYPSTVQVLKGERPATNAPATVDCLPGSELRYSNFGFVIVQQLIEDVTGRPFPGVARSAVLAPIDMSSSTFVEPLSAELEARAAQPHDLEGRAQPRFYNPNAVAQGGLWTTPSDLASLAGDMMRARAGRPARVFTPELTQTMLSPHFRELEGGKYWGLGFVILGNWGVLQAGSDPGFRSLLAAFPSRGQGLVVMLNGEGGELLQLGLLLNFVVEYVLRPISGHVVAGGVAALLLLSAVLVWPLGALRRVSARTEADRDPAGPDLARRARTARLLAVLTAVVMLGTVYPYVVCALDPGRSRWPATAAIALCGVLAVVLASFAVRAWQEGYWGLAGRVHFSLVSLAALVGSVLWVALRGLL